MDFQEHLLEQETDRLRLFADCVSKIAAVQGQEHDLSQVFSTALNQVVLVISARSAALTLVENNNLCVCAVYGEELNRVEGSIIPRNSEPLWDVVTTTDPYISTYWLGQHQQ